MALCGAAIVVTLSGAACEWTRGGGAWRIVTGHLTHWTYEQLAWDAIAFLVLGMACARRDLRAFHATLLASAIAIPIAVLVFASDIAAYRGLSGIDSALFGLLLVQARRSRLVIVSAIAFVAKIAFEAWTGGAVFATHMGADVVTVPVAHLAGAMIGALAGALREAGRAVSRRTLEHERPIA
ncbi:MAG TPA: rhomboid family intramembrane serine protease [Thermoanaerobaculia bacterium]|nr:rhomboid family intramembrane serine protease [Thermoanaerobaculia bacterium]